MADLNGDGLLDIYICNSGDIKGDNKENELYINQGDLTFKEEAKQFGLNDPGYTTHVSFFDYDLDGDLDCYIPVSYTHLRAHETPEHLVCRLLLEKKKKKKKG